MVDAAVGSHVRSDLRDIGKSWMESQTLPGGRFRVRGAAAVEHREKRRHYKFTLDMTFKRTGRRFVVEADASRFQGHSEDLADEVRRVVPFIYLVRTLAAPGPNDEPSVSFLAPHGYFVMRYGVTQRDVEVGLYQDDKAVARFYLPRDDLGPPNALARMVIPANDDVNIHFRRAP